MASFNNERGRYEIRGVMGPDEFHEAYPNASVPGSITMPTRTSWRSGFCPGLWRSLISVPRSGAPS
jgi:hypothetical protein